MQKKPRKLQKNVNIYYTQLVITVQIYDFFCFINTLAWKMIYTIII